MIVSSQDVSSKSSCSSCIIGCAVGILGLAILSAIVDPDRKPTNSETPRREQRSFSSADYAAGYARGRSEGVDHAKSGAGMPMPLGMNWMADMHVKSANPSDAESWKRGFKEGFSAGFTTVTPFNRDESEWEQLSWDNARSGVRLYNYNEKHEATIQTVDRPSGLITVRYRSGSVEPKELDAVSRFWWVRKR